MVSDNDVAQSSKTTEVQPPAYGNGDGGEVPKFREGLYILTNKMARTVLDMPHHTPGTRAHSYQRINSQWFGNQLWIIQQNGLNSTFTLKNFQQHSFLDLSAGDSQDGSQITGNPRVLGEETRLSQEWRLVEQAPRQYTIQCARTDTFLEFAKGDPSNGVKATCSKASEQKNNQIWDLERMSRSTLEVKAIIERWKPDLLPRLFQPYRDHAEYFVLPDEVRKSVWEKTGLRTQGLHEHMFDYDDFVGKAKDGVRTWAREQYPTATPGYSVLFGIIYGEANKGPKAYNWYLSPDMSSLVFFDAQTGREYTTAALDGFGFEPAFATF